MNIVYININKSNKIRYFFIFIRAKFDSVTYIRRRDVIEPGRSVTNSRAKCYILEGELLPIGEGEV